MNPRRLYSLLFTLGIPLILARLWWRGRKAPAYRKRILERFGFFTPLPPGPTLWLHTVSVGEFIAAQPLIRALRTRYPGHQVLITTMTPTGAERVTAAYGDEVFHRYIPYDLPGAVERFLARAHPDLGVVMETEVWPNLYHACRDRRVPLMLVNARMSERSARGYARFARLTRDTLRCLSVIAAQGTIDRDRLMALGAFAERIHVTGSIKYDLEIPADLPQRADHLRQSLGGSRPIWIAASTHSGEDEVVLDAFAKIREQTPTALLILVPRHPERFEQVQALCHSRGFFTVRRTEGRDCERQTQVFIGDTLGELMLFYACADVAFVGGSLVPSGGHNPLEPAALGLPVLTGPHTFNFAEIDKQLREAGGAQQVADADSLASAVTTLLLDELQRRAMGDAGRALVERNRGALTRVLDMMPLVKNG